MYVANELSIALRISQCGNMTTPNIYLSIVRYANYCILKLVFFWRKFSM